jgi:hypothetical protein
VETEYSYERGLLSITARQFGLPEEVLCEIEDTIRDRLRERALELAADNSWPDRRRDLSKAYGLVGRALQFLLAIDLAREFAELLRPMVFKSAEEYIDMFTRAMIECRRVRRRIHWRLIATQAMRFCTRETDWRHSSKWLVSMLSTAGVELEFYSGQGKGTFECMLLQWPTVFPAQDGCNSIGYFVDAARRRIRHLALLAPRTRIRMATEGLIGDAPMPVLADLRRKGSVTQRSAAAMLRCDPRTIRNYLRAGQLTGTKKAFIVCDNKLAMRLREVYGSALR